MLNESSTYHFPGQQPILSNIYSETTKNIGENQSISDQLTSDQSIFEELNAIAEEIEKCRNFAG